MKFGIYDAEFEFVKLSSKSESIYGLNVVFKSTINLSKPKISPKPTRISHPPKPLSWLDEVVAVLELGLLASWDEDNCVGGKGGGLASKFLDPQVGHIRSVGIKDAPQP